MSFRIRILLISLLLIFLATALRLAGRQKVLDLGFDPKPLLPVSFADRSRVEIVGIGFDGKVEIGKNLFSPRRRFPFNIIFGTDNEVTRSNRFVRSCTQQGLIRHSNRHDQPLGYGVKSDSNRLMLIVRGFDPSGAALSWAACAGDRGVVHHNITRTSSQKSTANTYAEMPFIAEVADADGRWHYFNGPCQLNEGEALHALSAPAFPRDKKEVAIRFTLSGQAPVVLHIPNPTPTTPAAWMPEPISTVHQLTEITLAVSKVTWARRTSLRPTLEFTVSMTGERAKFIQVNPVQISDVLGNTYKISGSSELKDGGRFYCQALQGIGLVKVDFQVSRLPNYPTPLTAENVLAEGVHTAQGLTMEPGPLGRRWGMQKVSAQCIHVGSEDESIDVETSFLAQANAYKESDQTKFFALYVEDSHPHGIFSVNGSGMDGSLKQKVNFSKSLRWEGRLPVGTAFKIVRPPQSAPETVSIIVQPPMIPATSLMR